MVKEYDCLIIGAGMSGMAAGIRLAMFGKKVAILEKHSISGGLNSYYQRGKRQFDVGLHAMTNFAARGERRRPLTKLLKQLRISHDQLQLQQQQHSVIHFPDAQLKFSNDFDLFRDSIHTHFPSQVDGLNQLLKTIEAFNETALDNPYQSAKQVVSTYIKDERLLEMIFCPLLIYGSAWEEDMDFSQFVIMFKSIFLEGFCRPEGGVRTIIDLLLAKLKEVDCPIHYKTGVAKIKTHQGKVVSIITNKGEELKTKQILSSAGFPETMNLIDQNTNNQPRIGRLGFTESILISPTRPRDYDLNTTIIFYNNSPKYYYKRPDSLFDGNSAVICLPNNFQNHNYGEGVYRITHMANYHRWKDLERKEYLQEKEKVFEFDKGLLAQLIPNFKDDILFKDVFTPTTIERYTGHFNGTVYGSPDKSRDGRTPIEGLNLCGTDQGFLGIIGAMLSGISMANYHGLMD